MEHLRTRLRHLLLLLLDALDGKDHDGALSVADLRELLGGAGLAEDELSELLHWFHDRNAGLEDDAWLSAQRVELASERALRQMGAEEDSLITVPAFGYLLNLVRTGQISAEQMETMIQYAQLVPDGPLGLDDLPPLLDRVVFTEQPGASPVAGAGSDRAH